MYYMPHKLYVKVYKEPSVDQNGDAIPGTGGFDWEEIGGCRCDDNGGSSNISINGVSHIYEYHIVFNGKRKLHVGDEVKALGPDGTVRGGGTVIKPGKCNFLNYSEIWI